MVVSEGAINNIMGGMENTAGVRLHSHRHKLKQRFDIVRKLGQGTYGKVQLAINKETGQEVAIKTIKKAKIETEQDLIRIRREIQIMSSVQHPQIIHIYEVFENREKMVLVMEYAAGGELYDYLSERKVLQEPEARRVFRQVASAVYYCHKHKICHRDLKLENILLDLDGNAKIADFGLSNVFDEKHRLDTFCGSPLYASPEIVKGVPYIGPEVDCWSLGVLLYTLVYGAMPFDGSNFRRLVKQITQGDFYEPSTPANASELIRHMLTVQPAERASVEHICSHWWVNEGFSESCLIEAEALASQTPVRLDLLLSLAPKQISSEHMLIQPDDEDLSQMSTSDRPPPELSIPPPPPSLSQTEGGAEGDTNNGVTPARSHSLGSLPPESPVDIELLLEKKRRERKVIQEEKKRHNEELSTGEKKKKKDFASKKPPTRAHYEDAERKTLSKKESTEERVEREEKKKSLSKKVSTENKEEEKKILAKKGPTEEKSEKEERKKVPNENDVDKIEKKKSVKKRESSLTRKSSIKKESKEPVESESEPKTETLVPPCRRLPSPSPSTDATLKVSDSSISRSSISPAKVPAAAELHPEPKEATLDLPKTDSSTKIEMSVTPTPKEPTEKDTEKILQETAAKIENVETLQKKGDDTPPSHPVSSSIASSINSVTSSQATTPARSRTGSESSTEARSSRAETASRRQSKILSKAALFDNMLSPNSSKSPPPVEKPKKITRPGTLNMSDLAKKFEEKPTMEKKNKVLTPFKVSDARKTFEAKADKSLSVSPRVITSTGSSGDSAATSPRDSLPTSPKDSLPTSPKDSLPTSPKDSLPTSPKDSLPTSPKSSLPNSPRESLPTSPTREKSSSQTSSSESEVVLARKSSSAGISKSVDKFVKKETSPTKEISVALKSPSKETSPSKSWGAKKEKSPIQTAVIKKEKVEVKPKEKSPVKDKENVQPKPSNILSSSKLKEPTKQEEKSEPKTPIEKPNLTSKAESKPSKEVLKPQTTTTDKTKLKEGSVVVGGVNLKLGGSKISEVETRQAVIRVDSESSDSESEAEKLLRQLAEKRERVEIAKKEKLRKVSEVKDRELVTRDMPAIREETRSSASESPQEIKEHKFATLPRGFKSKEADQKILKPKCALEINQKFSEEDISNKRSGEPVVRRIPVVKEVVPIPPEQVLASTPRTPVEQRDLKKTSLHTRVNSTEESESSDSLCKKSQMEIVINNPTQKKQPQKSLDRNKQSSFTEIHISSPIVKESSTRPAGFRTEIQHNVGVPDISHGSSPVRSQMVEPHLQRARRERIIPIMLEDDDVTSTVKTSSRTSIQPSSSSSSKASSVSSMPSRVSNYGTTPMSSTTGSSAAAECVTKRNFSNSPDTIRKSRRERIIPIAVEGEGIITPPISESASSETIRNSFQRQGSSQSSFNRGRGFMLDRNESFSSAGEDDEEDEDDGFQILTAESLFSTLLSRVRSLTRKMTADEPNRPDRLRRTPQPSVSNPDASVHPAGFWSSLYSPTRDSPARRISETLSRGQSREDDPFGGFASPLWGRSMSRDGSDSESIFPEHAAPFNTLPRGWRSRRSGKEEMVEPDSSEGSAVFTSIRRPLYSRTLSRDLPLKSNDNAYKSRSSWDASSSNSTLPRTTATNRPTSPRFSQDQVESVASMHIINSPTSDGASNLRDRPQYNSRNSGESFGRVGGQYERQEKQQPCIAQMVSPSTSKQSVQQLKELVDELESVQVQANPNDLSPYSEKNNQQQHTFLEKPTGKVTLLMSSSGGKIQPISSPQPSKSLSSFQKLQPQVSHPVLTPNNSSNYVNSKSSLNQQGSVNHSNIPKSQNKISPITNSSSTYEPSTSSSELNSNIKSSPNSNKVDSEKESSEQFSDTKLITLCDEHSKENAKNANNIGANVKKNSLINNNPNLNPNNASHKNLYADKQICSALCKVECSTTKTDSSKEKIPKVTSLNEANANDGVKRNGCISRLEINTSENKIQPNSGLGQTWSKLNDQYRRASTPEKKNFLTIEPYRRGKSEDLKAAIDIVNQSDTFKEGGSKGNQLRVYRKSKSRDITPAIEAASEKLTQLNSSTLKRISPFEAYRRSKSKELASVISQVTNDNNCADVDTTCSSVVHQNNVISKSQFEKAKSSLEKKFEKSKSPPLESQHLSDDLKPEIPDTDKVNEKVPSKEVKKSVSVSFNIGKSNEISKETEKALSKEKTKENDKPKSMYKMLTSKFSRSLSNVGEDPKVSEGTGNKQKENEENNEKEEKFKLIRPSRFLKPKMEKSSSRLSVAEIDTASDDVDPEKCEKKTSKISNAFNKFLGRKSEDSSLKSVKREEHVPTKSTSTTGIAEKLKKPPRFRAKNFSKSHEHLNQKMGDDGEEEEEVSEKADCVIPEKRETDEVTLESATKGICSHLSQIEINITSRLGNMANSSSNFNPVNGRPLVTACSVPSLNLYGLSPSLPNRRLGHPSQAEFNVENENCTLNGHFLSPASSNATMNDDRSITPTESGNESSTHSGLDDIKETEDESVMDRITRKSYYSRFNETKRKPKLRRIDSRESIDQQLAAAKARLMQEDDMNLRCARESLSPSKIPSTCGMMTSSPPPIWEGVTRRSIKKTLEPRTTSLPPDEGMIIYMGGMRSPPAEGPMSFNVRSSVERDEPVNYYRSSVRRDDENLYARQPSVPRDESSNHWRLSSVTRDDPSFHIRQASVMKEDNSGYRLPSVTREDLQNYRRFSTSMREEPQVYRCLSSGPKEEPQIYHRPSAARDESINHRRTASSNFEDNSQDKRLSSVPRDHMGYKRYSLANGDHPGYHTLQYRKSSKMKDDYNCNRLTPSYSRDPSSVHERGYHQKHSSYGDDNFTRSSSISPTAGPNQRHNQESIIKSGNIDKTGDVMAAVSAAGKLAGAAAAASVVSSEFSQSIPSPFSNKPTLDSAAVESAREKLTRRLTPLTRLSSTGSGDTSVKPYRRTVTYNNLPSNPGSTGTSTIERPAYRRTNTMDLPPTDSRIRTNDYRRVLQDPSRRFTGIRSPEDGSDVDVKSSTSMRSPYYPLPSTSSFTAYGPPSMNSLLKRNSLYRY